ncbi:MAG: hypothetical protein WCT17_02645 [Bacilli bacterium]
MKKRLIFLPLLMFFALFTFTGCSLFSGGEETDLTNVTSFEVIDDSAQEMVYNNATDEALFQILVVMNIAEADSTIETYESMFDILKANLNYAKITEAQIISLASLCETNEVLLTAVQEVSFAELDTDQLSGLLEFLKDALAIVGNDAAGKLMYQMALQDADEETTTAIEAVGYETFVASSRMVFAIINSVLESIDSADINLVSSIMASEQGEPTNAEMVQLLGIASDALEAISLTDATWEQFFTIISTKITELTPLTSENEMIEGMSNEDAIATIQETLNFLGEYITVDLKFLSTVLDGIDVEFINIMKTSAYSEYFGWSEETFESIYKYYIDDEEVTEDEYNEFEFVKIAQVFSIITQAYDTLSATHKTKIEAEIVGVLTIANTELEEAAQETYTYDGDTSTFSDVINQLKAFAALDFDSLALDDVEAEFEDTMAVLTQYLGTNAPYLVQNAFSEKK